VVFQKLASLIVSSGELIPAFNNSVFSYTVSVPNNQDSVTITANPISSTVTLDINGQLLTSNVPSNPLSLSVGSNVFSINLNSIDIVDSSTYVISIERARCKLN